jgi:tetratricopeptide (TPR) repeat protein
MRATPICLALANWPDDLVARIGLGNIAYGRHQLPEAQAQYRRATQAHADSGDAWNNLAQVLHELGRDAGGRGLRTARAGPRRAETQATYRATLEAIQANPK